MNTTRTTVSRLKSRTARITVDLDALITRAAIGGAEWAILDRLSNASSSLHAAWRELEGVLQAIRDGEEDEL